MRNAFRDRFCSFGVCCLFTTSECGDRVTSNNTYLRNEGFPGQIDDPQDCTYIIEKSDSGTQ